MNLHQLLCLRAEKWLSDDCGCSVVIRDPFKAATAEQPDVIGWRGSVSILIEVKTSRADFHADQNKSFRLDPEKGMGAWRFYLCPPGIIRTSEIPHGWGLLYALPKAIKKVQGVPPNTLWYTAMPNEPNREAEVTMLVSTLRRLACQGELPKIYNGDRYARAIKR